MKYETVKQTSDAIRNRLSEYIEARYNIKDKSLVRQRREILETPGNIYQIPYIESTKKYQSGQRFEEIDGIGDAFLDCVEKLDGKEIFNPPYSHQLEAVESVLVNDKNIVVMSGTGSGKTECFLWPILGKISEEAKNRPKTYKEHKAMRALILYPMNALVNDQLGRLRQLFGSKEVKELYKEWTSSERIVTFAKYTGRTPYPGKRDSKRSSQKLKMFKELIDLQASNTELYEALKKLGKWPAKDDLAEWYGQDNTAWDTRCLQLSNDSELLIRQEVQEDPPDILITNYSMLSYMLMRPIERIIFERTAKWLEQNPEEKFILCLDEAHLYRGSGGTEVSFLIRRLIERLNIDISRVQVISTSASFSSKRVAKEFINQLTGVPNETIKVIGGSLIKNEHAEEAKKQDLEELLKVNLEAFYEGEILDKKESLSSFFNYRNISIEDITVESSKHDLHNKLYQALKDFKPLSLLLNQTMEKAEDLNNLRELIFPEANIGDGDAALTVLIALATNAKKERNESGLLSSRVHLFLRGLPGLWVCLNKKCNAKDHQDNDSHLGKLYSEPRDRCKCNAKVYELLTCRYCGTTATKVFMREDMALDDQDQPLWSEGGEEVISDGDIIEALSETHLLLEDPGSEQDIVRPSKVNIYSGILRPRSTEEAIDVWVNAGDEKVIKQCPKCKKSGFGNTFAIQDMQTKGVEPIKSVISKQIEIQQKKNQSTKDSPLGGRKVLAFSDSRKNASTLVTAINKYSLDDTIRPLVALGYQLIQDNDRKPTLDYIYTGLMIGSALTNTRLRTTDESVNQQLITNERDFFRVIDNIESITEDTINDLLRDSPSVPDLIAYKILQSVFHNRFGFYSLAIASIKESSRNTLDVNDLQQINEFTETEEQKRALVRLWLYYSINSQRFYKPLVSQFNNTLWDNPDSAINLKWRKANALMRPMESFLGDAKNLFKKHWLEVLHDNFSEIVDKKSRIKAKSIDLDFLANWMICDNCRGVQEEYPLNTKCIHCYSTNALKELDPNQDSVFSARVSYDRSPIIGVNEAISTDFEHVGTVNLITKEHTAQLSSSTDSSVFNEAERNELNFQDIKLDDGETNVDILSCTTTMEVGIDIGSLTGVSLRGLPPARSNYQQRAGRAGRRGNSIATVISYGNTDSHDQHFFSNPAEMIKGQVEDPRLNLKNDPIAERHINAFLLEKYQLEHIQINDDIDTRNLYSSLGSSKNFYNGNESTPPSFAHFETWVGENTNTLLGQLNSWLPQDLEYQNTDFKSHVEAIQKVGEPFSGDSNDREEDSTEIETIETDFNTVGSDKSNKSNNLLLDALMHSGILPQYGFPTDLIAFHVFKDGQRGYGGQEFKYDPTAAISVALSSYAPGKEITIGGNLYTSSAIYSPFSEQRYEMWQNKKAYSECSSCNNVEYKVGATEKDGSEKPCSICKQGKLRPEKWSIEPVGFAHSHTDQSKTGAIDMSFSMTTTARFRAPSPSDDDDNWKEYEANIRVIQQRSSHEHPILITNNGPKSKGYDYCTKCGVIEPHNLPQKEKILRQDTPHQKPYPIRANEQLNCEGAVSKGIVLGCQILTDLLLVSFRFDKEDSLALYPDSTIAKTILTTLCEALSIAAARKLEVDPREIAAGYRFSNSDLSVEGKEMEIFLYDTLSGGGGYSSSLYDSIEELFEETLKILTACPEECDSSCYKCLRSFSNKHNHKRFDRLLTASFLEYAMSNQYLDLDKERSNASIDILARDLKRQGRDWQINTNQSIESEILERNIDIPIVIKTNEEEFYICLENPLNHEIYDEDIAELEDYANVHKVSDFIIRKNLAAATKSILNQIGN